MKKITALTFILALLVGCSNQGSAPEQGDCDFVGPLEKGIEQPKDCE